MCYSDIVCENTSSSSSSSSLGSDENEDIMTMINNVNERMNGGVKSMEVTLKQDGEKSRLGEVDVDGAVEENALSSARTMTGSVSLFVLVVGSLFVLLL